MRAFACDFYKLRRAGNPPPTGFRFCGVGMQALTIVGMNMWKADIAAAAAVRVASPSARTRSTSQQRSRSSLHTTSGLTTEVGVSPVGTRAVASQPTPLSPSAAAIRVPAATPPAAGIAAPPPPLPWQQAGTSRTATAAHAGRPALAPRPSVSFAGVPRLPAASNAAVPATLPMLPPALGALQTELRLLQLQQIIIERERSVLGPAPEHFPACMTWGNKPGSATFIGSRSAKAGSVSVMSASARNNGASRIPTRLSHADSAPGAAEVLLSDEYFRVGRGDAAEMERTRREAAIHSRRRLAAGRPVSPGPTADEAIAEAFAFLHPGCQHDSFSGDGSSLLPDDSVMAASHRSNGNSASSRASSCLAHSSSGASREHIARAVFSSSQSSPCVGSEVYEAGIIPHFDVPPVEALDVRYFQCYDIDARNMSARGSRGEFTLRGGAEQRDAGVPADGLCTLPTTLEQQYPVTSRCLADLLREDSSLVYAVRLAAYTGHGVECMDASLFLSHLLRLCVSRSLCRWLITT
ncbi:MAG: hypothetical protein EOO65_03355 [Methanosarcinales archaeon]|nr:MAG: hypothetical protein EOO65_03355 [Methanosarcinales archaeon]